MKRVFFLVLVLISSLGLSGCRRHLAQPESIDPVFLDLKQLQEKTLGALAEAQKDLDKAKNALENAPIRTGQRQDALEDLFAAQKKFESLVEKYRYQALRVSNRMKADRKSYELAFKSNTPWPDPEEAKLYLAEKRLADAPKEWDPQNRIKKRKPAAAPPSEAEGEAKKE